jgi:hypothetical protein
MTKTTKSTKKVIAPVEPVVSTTGSVKPAKSVLESKTLWSLAFAIALVILETYSDVLPAREFSLVMTILLTLAGYFRITATKIIK